MIAEYLEEIPNDRPILVYGAGEGGRFLCKELLRTRHYIVSGFVDSFKAGSFDGYPIYALQDVLSRGLHTSSRIVIASSAHRSIDPMLREQGIMDHVDAFPYIERNIHVLPATGPVRAPMPRLPKEAVGLLALLRRDIDAKHLGTIARLERTLSSHAAELESWERHHASWFQDAVRWRVARRMTEAEDLPVLLQQPPDQD